MKIQYLGTAAAEGLPGLYCNCDICMRATQNGGKDIRTRSQAVIDDQLLMDLPPDTYHHVLQHGLNLKDVRSLIITHSHQDHFYVQELMMRAFPFAHGTPEKKLTVYGNDKVRAMFEAAVKESGNKHLQDVLEFKEVQPYEAFTTIEGYTVTPMLANHDKKERCLIYLIEKDGQCIFYANDSGFYPEATWDYLKGKHLDLVSFDCTTVLEKEGSNHMGLADNREAKQKLIELGCVDANTKFVVTHFSHNGGALHADIVHATEGDGFLVAFDGFEVKL